MRAPSTIASSFARMISWWPTRIAEAAGGAGDYV
jgi:hypothetical protein